MSEYKPGSIERRRFFITLWELAASHKRLPKSITLEKGQIALIRELYNNGLTIIREGRYKGNPVAVTNLRNKPVPDFRLTMTVRRSATPWASYR